MWWKAILFLLMAWVIAAAFILPAPQQGIGEASRIFYFHVPQAWVAAVAFVVSMIASIRYLRKGDLLDDDRARAAAELGFLFCVLATITGSIFAKVTWQSFWNWDPRETSIFILLLIYGAYFALRSAVDGAEKKARLAAVYSIFAFVTVPFLMFIMPRVLPSLHPSDSVVGSSGEFAMSASTAAVFFPSLIAFTVLFFWIYSIGVRIYRSQRKRMEEQES
ncbi:MAG: cytochrome c biogenesis protein [candidate division Zixibacteria bacterium]|nr:cytochrome c biogenesis protein [candidate division Zixibacteria bacterium]